MGIAAGTLLCGAGTVCGRESTSLTLAEKICNSYTQVVSIACQVRKTTSTGGQTAKMLSRVYYQRPDRLYVENITPLDRRILSDGARFYLHQAGWKKCYSVPLAELPEEWAIMRAALPATAMEHLLRLQGVAEETLEAQTDTPVRRGYQKPNLYVVLACDAEGRLTRIEFYKDRTLAERTAVYQYENFLKATDNCWLAARQTAEVTLGGDTLQEVRQFDNLQVNQSVDEELFNAQNFLNGLECVSDFTKVGAESDSSR